jgi:hypothetical protein
MAAFIDFFLVCSMSSLIAAVDTEAPHPVATQVVTLAQCITQALARVQHFELAEVVGMKKTAGG